MSREKGGMYDTCGGLIYYREANIGHTYDIICTYRR